MVETATEVTTMSEKGQIVIPQSIRKEMGIKPKTKLLVYGKNNLIIMKKIDAADLVKEWDDIVQQMSKKGLKMSYEEIQKEVDVVRAANR